MSTPTTQRRVMHPRPSDPPLYGDRRRVAFVTGAARGIGRAITLRLAKDGLDVAINDRDEAELLDTKAEVEKLGAKCIALVGDVGDEKRVEQMVQEAASALGYVDIMVANAGLAQNRPIVDMGGDKLDRVLRVNMVGVHNCYRFAAKQMINQGTGGKLIAAGSVHSFDPAENISAYVASKHAVRGYNQTAALELAKFGITANCYAPGGTATRMIMREPLPTDSEDTKARLLDGLELVRKSIEAVPMKRIGEPEDIANLVSFLASRDSDYITGQALKISGGLFML